MDVSAGRVCKMDGRSRPAVDSCEICWSAFARLRSLHDAGIALLRTASREWSQLEDLPA